jgi:monoamine oxidase
MEFNQDKRMWQERKSLWSATSEIERRESLPANQIDADVVIIGAGLVGILTAHMLKGEGIESVVLEAKEIGSGVTQNTTAKITSQHNLIYHKLIKDFGREKAEQYAKSNEWAIAKYKQLVADKGIECNLANMPSYLYTLEDEHIDIIRAESEAAASLGIQATFLEEGELGRVSENKLQSEGNQSGIGDYLFLLRRLCGLIIRRNFTH